MLELCSFDLFILLRKNIRNFYSGLSTTVQRGDEVRLHKITFKLLVSLLLISGCSNNESDQQKKRDLEIISEYDQLPDTYKNGETEFSIHSNKERYVLPVDSIGVVITNTGSNAIGFGEYRTLEKIQEDTWYPVPYREQVSFGDIGLGLEPGGNTEQEMPLEYLNYELSPGTYRIVKTFRVNEDINEVALATQFEIE